MDLQKLPDEIVGKIEQLKAAQEMVKVLETELDEFKNKLKLTMLETGKHKVDIEGVLYATLATRTSYKTDDPKSVPPKLRKTVLDTSAVGKYESLYGKLPDTITKTDTPYLARFIPGGK